ncbi:PP2C family protein-serine/threonine phosphatase [Streptomyces sp. NPDC002004]
MLRRDATGRIPWGAALGPRRARRALTLGPPLAWGAVAITYKLACPLAQQNGLDARIASSAVFFAVGTGLVLHVRGALLREMRQLRRVAGAAQDVLLRPPPPRVDDLTVAAGQLSADRGARVGGDLYDVVATDHGVRVVMGDVRGHGLPALATVAALLGSFREAAHDEPELVGVLRRLERAHERHLRERCRAGRPPAADAEPETPVAEEFVTVLLMQIDRDGTMTALNCGHPWPYLYRQPEPAAPAESSTCLGPAEPGGADPLVEPVPGGEPMPPLGLFPLPAEPALRDCGTLLPGQALFVHTDGAEDARDARGRFFPLRSALVDAVRAHPLSPHGVIRRVHAQLLRHTDGQPSDDAALLVLRNDRRRVPLEQGELLPGPARKAG